MPGIPEVLSSFPACSDLVFLQFDGRVLTMFAAGLVKQYPAVSGKLHGNFSLAAQKDKGLGPIPAGSYWIDPEQMWTAGPVRDWLSEHTPLSTLWGGWGEHRVTIHPLPTTQTYGRGGFFIHGGDHIGSAGCIHVTGIWMEAFVQDLKAKLSGLPTCSISLQVKYP